MISAVTVLGYYFLRINPWILVILSVWDITWRGVALWKSSRGGQRYWFIALMVVNSIGILPLVYLFFFQRKPVEKKRMRKKP